MGRAGFTLFEVMVSLAILTMLLGVVVSAARPPSPALKARAEVSQLIRDAANVRLMAIRSGTPQIWVPDATACDAPAEFRFFSDGTATGPDLCLFNLRLSLHPLTGQLHEIKP